MLIYQNNRSKIGFYALYAVSAVLAVLGVWIFFADSPTNPPILGVFLFGLGALCFAGFEWYFRRYIQQIEVLDDGFRITTNTIFGVKRDEGELRPCYKLKEAFRVLKFLGNLGEQTITADGVFYVMEPSNRRYILDTTDDSSAKPNLNRAIRKLRGLRV